MEYWEAIDSEINKQIDYVSKTVIQGVSSLEEYKFLCGQIQGLMVAKRINNDLAQRISQDE